MCCCFRSSRPHVHHFAGGLYAAGVAGLPGRLSRLHWLGGLPAFNGRAPFPSDDERLRAGRFAVTTSRLRALVAPADIAGFGGRRGRRLAAGAFPFSSKCDRPGSFHRAIRPTNGKQRVVPAGLFLASCISARYPPAPHRAIQNTTQHNNKFRPVGLPTCAQISLLRITLRFIAYFIINSPKNREHWLYTRALVIFLGRMSK